MVDLLVAVRCSVLGWGFRRFNPHGHTRFLKRHSPAKQNGQMFLLTVTASGRSWPASCCDWLPSRFTSRLLAPKLFNLLADAQPCAMVHFARTERRCGRERPRRRTKVSREGMSYDVIVLNCTSCATLVLRSMLELVLPKCALCATLVLKSKVAMLELPKCTSWMCELEMPKCPLCTTCAHGCSLPKSLQERLPARCP